MKDLPEIVVIKDFFNGRRFFRKGDRLRPTGTLRQKLIRSGHAELVKSKAMPKAVVSVPKQEEAPQVAQEVAHPPATSPRKSRQKGAV